MFLKLKNNISNFPSDLSPGWQKHSIVTFELRLLRAKGSSKTYLGSMPKTNTHFEVLPPLPGILTGFWASIPLPNGQRF